MNPKDWDNISKDYYSSIISPIRNGKKPNPLLECIKIVKGKKAIDLGCGIGPMEPLLTDKFEQITAIDFSEDMIKIAKEKNKNLSNVIFEVGDMTSLEKYSDFTYAFAINSILSPKIQDIEVIFKQIHNLLKNKGKLIAVLPAMESYIYQGMLIMDKELKKGISQDDAKKKAIEFLHPKEHDLIIGKINYDGEQKTFYRFEIKHRLKKAGFTKIKIKKLRYNWNAWKSSGQTHFPSEDSPWDWFVECQKN